MRAIKPIWKGEWHRELFLWLFDDFDPIGTVYTVVLDAGTRNVSTAEVTKGLSTSPVSGPPKWNARKVPRRRNSKRRINGGADECDRFAIEKDCFFRFYPYIYVDIRPSP